MQSCPEYSVSLTYAQLFHQHFKRFSNECQLPSRYLNCMFKVFASCSNTKSKSLSKRQCCLISEHTVNFCGKSFHIDSNAVFNSAMLVGFGMYSVPVLYPIHDNPVD